MTIGKLSVLLGLNSAQFSAGLHNSANHVRKFRHDVTGATTTLATLANVATRATAAVGALYAVFRAARPAEAFSQSMANSTAIMGDLSQKMRQQMAQAAKEVATETKFSASETAAAYYYLASAGMNAQQSIAALPQVAKFAQAGMFDLSLATDLATDAQSALGLVVKDPTKNLENLTRVTDVLVKANTLANASTQQFSEALTNKSGAALRALGKDIEEGVAVLAAFADQGVKGEEAGTQFAIVLRDLQTKAIENAAAFEANRVKVFDSAGEMRNMADIMSDLENRLGGMSDELKKTTLLQMGFSDKSLSALQTLLGTSEKIRDYEEGLRRAGGTTEEVANKQLPLFTKQWERLKTLFERLSTVVFTPVLWLLGATLSAINPILEVTALVLEKVSAAFSSLFGRIGAWLKRLGLMPSEVSKAQKSIEAATPKIGAMADATARLNEIAGETPGTLIAATSAVDEFMKSLQEEIRFGNMDEMEKRLELMKEMGDFNITTTAPGPTLQKDMNLSALKDMILAEQANLMDLVAEFREAENDFGWRFDDPLGELEKQIEAKQGRLRDLTAQYRKIAMTPVTETVTSFDADKYNRVRDAMHEVLEARRRYDEFMNRTQEHQSLMQAGRSLTESLETPMEAFKRRVAEANRMVEIGAIGWQTYTREIAAARQELVSLQSQLKGPSLVERGSQADFESLDRWRAMQEGLRGLPDVPMPKMGEGPASLRRPPIEQEEMIPITRVTPTPAKDRESQTVSLETLKKIEKRLESLVAETSRTTNAANRTAAAAERIQLPDVVEM